MKEARVAALAVAAPRAVRPPWNTRLASLVSAYLPLVVMGLLALGSWWLVKNTPLAEGPGAEAPLRHEPDYTMRDFKVQRFARDGTMRTQIEGDLALHYPDTDTLEIENPRVRAIAPNGRVTIASAARALANGDGSEVQLLVGAHVTREATPQEAAIDFRSDFLHVFLNSEQVRSHLPVIVTQGATVVRAAGMEYDNLARVVDLKGRMHAVFASPPRGARR
ncbi:MAG: LPS export ABC transporter periplasmic protein LptC [Caldimonas sp.]